MFFASVPVHNNIIISYTEMENFTVFVMTVLLCITVNMTNAQGEVTL